MLNKFVFLAFLHLVPTTTATQSIQNVTQVFRSAHIVPDVIPAFGPSLLLDVSFGGRTVVPGETLTKNGTVMAPTFSIQGTTTATKFVILMVDPDAPSPPNRTLADIRHLLAGNLVPSTPLSNNSFDQLRNTTPAVSEYLPPGPPPGSPPHRYTLLIYAQPDGFDTQKLVNASTSRLAFNLTQFTAAVGFGQPLGGNMFYVGSESMVPGAGSTTSGSTLTPTGFPTSSASTIERSQMVLALSFIIAVLSYWHP